MRIDGGATLWARKTIESDLFVWRSDKWFKIWFFIINKVNHKDIKYFARGEGFMTYDDIRRGTGATQSQVDKFIRYGKRTTMLTTHKTTRGMTVKVLNYHKYQSLENYKSDTKSDNPDEMKAKRKRNESDRINKNDKNVKNEIYIGAGIDQENFAKAVKVLEIKDLLSNQIKTIEKLIEKYPSRDYELHALKCKEWWFTHPRKGWKRPILAFANWLANTKIDDEIIVKKQRAELDKKQKEREQDQKIPVNPEAMKKIREGMEKLSEKMKIK